MLRRRWVESDATIGELYVDGVWEAFTCEDIVRAEKIPGKTAIPAGRYEVVMDWSPKFSTPLPHLMNVPNFTGVRIHAGNGPEDTEGCILVGRLREGGRVLASRAALDPLIQKLREGLKKGPVWLHVENVTGMA
jgi:hypothetical protein